MSDDKSKQAETKPGNGALAIKLTLAILVFAAAIGLYVQFGDRLALGNLAQHEARLRSYQETHPLFVLAIAFVIYVAVTGLSIPGAAALSLAFAWYFGFPKALVLISFASTTGATLAFLLSRFVLRDAIQRRFGERLSAFNKALQDEGAFYLFTLRLIPAVPFFVINAVMGLTPIKTRTFWWVSQVGMLPGTIAYVWAGSSVPDLKTLAQQGVGGILSVNLLIAFAVLGITPLVLKKLVQSIRSRRIAYAEPNSSDS